MSIVNEAVCWRDELILEEKDVDIIVERTSTEADVSKIGLRYRTGIDDPSFFI